MPSGCGAIGAETKFPARLTDSASETTTIAAQVDMIGAALVIGRRGVVFDRAAPAFIHRAKGRDNVR
jgi:hypothetical protein